jgi:hypothetical protein
LSLGLVKLQHSVWVYPYECQEIIDLIKGNFDIVREVVYIVAEKIENDKWLKEKFRLR